jgi:glycosyltransferase involved in cell wall biosynthesis
MRVDVWAPSFVQFGGGITAFSRELAIALERAGMDVRLFALHDRSTSWERRAVVGCGAFGRLRRVAFACRVLGGAIRRRPDVIVVTHTHFGPLARVAKALSRSRYAIVAHGVEVQSQLSRSRLTAIRRAERVLAVSTWTKERALSIGVSDSKIDVVGNSVDEHRFTVGAAPQSLRDRYGLAEDQRVVLTVARLHTSEGYKGYDAVIRALPALRTLVPSVRYLIAGDGDDRARVEAVASANGVRDLVTFCGFVPDHELADHYRLADVFVMPSRGEGFGIVFLESMACGTPVIAGDCDGSRDALMHGALGRLVDTFDVDALASAMRSVLSKEGKWWWFDRAELRRRVLLAHGRPEFSNRCVAAIRSAAATS